MTRASGNCVNGFDEVEFEVVGRGEEGRRVEVSGDGGGGGGHGLALIIYSTSLSIVHVPWSLWFGSCSLNIVSPSS